MLTLEVVVALAASRYIFKNSADFVSSFCYSLLFSTVLFNFLSSKHSSICSNLEISCTFTN